MSVPSELAASTNDFSFQLPAELAAAAAGNQVRVTREDGGSLPDWLRYVAGTNSIAISTVPPGSLPLSLSVRIGARQWLVVIEERAGG